jgi:hypothetical protein
MTVLYRYQVDGRDRDGQTWMVRGEVQTRDGGLSQVVMDALRESFMAVTEGRAVYGHPGVTCTGPYVITRVLLERVETEMLMSG